MMVKFDGKLYWVFDTENSTTGPLLGVYYSMSDVLRAAEDHSRQHGYRVTKFPGQVGTRRHGTNWTVTSEDGRVAADHMGNAWAFRTRASAEKHLVYHRPLYWVRHEHTDER